MQINQTSQLKYKKLKVGKILNFKAKDKDNKDFNLTDVKGKKVISVFPALNTKICDEQTLQVVSWSQAHKDWQFISVTNDGVDIISNWCAAHNISNITIVSDRAYKEFAKATRLLIKLVNKLNRGFIILDENNKILAISFKAAYKSPDYDFVKNYL